jgi:hypothetical protein
MAEEILLKETLTEEMKSLGASLTRALDEAGWPVVASFWYFEDDFNRWKLYLASSRVNTDGKKEAYGAVINALKALHQSRASLSDLTVVAPDDPLVRSLASAIQTGWTISGIPFSRQAINGSIFEDAYVYRVTSESAAA